MPGASHDFGELLRARAQRAPDRCAYVFLAEGEQEAAQLTFGELDRAARSLAAQLQHRMAAGERALLLHPPGLELVAALFACLYAGSVAVPVCPPRNRRSMEHLERLAADAGASIVLTTSPLLARLAPWLEGCPRLQALPWLTTEAPDDAWAEGWRETQISSETLALVQYTSGSTSSPRGVMVTHGNLLHNASLMQAASRQRESWVGVSWLPHYHDMGLIGSVLQTVYVGGRNVLMSPLAFLQKPERWLQAISRYGATASGGPSFSYDLCVRAIPPERCAGLDLGTWEVAFNGAEPIRPGVLERFCETFGPFGFRREAFFPCYGLAEVTLFVSGGPPGAGLRKYAVLREALAHGRVVETGNGKPHRVLASCGRIFPGLTVRVVDPESLTESAPDRIGEIWVRGPSVAAGYWNRPEETERTFQARLLDNGEGPYLRTGDLGFLRGEDLIITGRRKDLIILCGCNHYAEDVEATVQASHPLLEGSGAAFSVEMDDAERLVVVHEVGRRFRPGEAGEVFAAVRRRVLEVHEVEVWGIDLVKTASVPRTSSNKVQRAACRQRFLEGNLDTVASWRAGREAGPERAPAVAGQEGFAALDLRPFPASRTVAAVEEWLIQAIAATCRMRPGLVAPGEPLHRYGLDSLASVRLVAKLEEMAQRSLPAAQLTASLTIRDLARLLVPDAPAEEGGMAPPAAGTTPATSNNPRRLPYWQQRLEALNGRYLEAKASGGYLYQSVLAPAEGPWVSVEGRRMLMLASYGYLGLLGHPKIVRAAKAAVDLLGTGTHGVPLLAGTTPLHRELEETVARFKRTRAAAVFSSGYVTNLTVISALLGPGDVVICDSYNHASIVDGCRLSEASLLVFEHNDLGDLERCLTLAGDAGKLVIVDAVFSMEGDVVNLPEVVELCRRHDALLMVDEAHSLGVLGQTGHGIEEHFGLAPEAIDVKMGTFSKAIPSSGGYVAGSAELITALKHNTHAFIFSAALAPPQAAAAKAALEVIEEEPERVARLRCRAEQYLAGLRRIGFDTLASTTPIVPISCPNEELTANMARLCRERGLFVVPVVYPAVPVAKPRLRTTVTSAHSEEDVDFALSVLEEVAKEVGLLSGRGS